MTSGGTPRNAWLRMTDTMGLTEPGKKAQRPGRRILLFWVVLWTLSTVLWWTRTILEFSEGTQDYLSLILAVLTLVLAVAYSVMLWQSRKASKSSTKT